MVDDAVTAPEPRLAVTLAPADRRAALVALFDLDDRLATILRTTREALVGQMRLTWWHAALSALDTDPAPAEPVLQALASEVLPMGVRGETLAGQIDGWEALLEQGVPDRVAMATFAAARGGGVFAAAGRVLGADAPIARAGEAWALADLSRHLSDAGAAAGARAMAGERFAELFAPRWPRAARPLGAMAIAAMLDLEGRAGLRRAARLARHLATGG